MSGPPRAIPCVFLVGETSSSTLSFDADSIRDFAALSGDVNPLHHDETRARNTRFGGLIACAGQSTACMMGALATFLTARGDALGLEFGFKLWKAVRAGQAMALTWTVREVALKPNRDAHILALDAVLSEPDGSAVITAWSKAIVYAEGSQALRRAQ